MLSTMHVNSLDNLKLIMHLNLEIEHRIKAKNPVFMGVFFQLFKAILSMAQTLLKQLSAGEAKFSDVLAYIEAAYTHTPTAFKNGAQHNAASENQGSAKVFSFAQLNNLDQAQTLALFAEHYASVMVTPEGTDHQNIRQFMQHGWLGIQFEGTALTAK